MVSCPPLSLSYASRREVIERVAPNYRTSSLAQKMLLLDRVVEVTGYARKYAIRLLGGAAEGKRTIERRRLPRYGAEVQQALVEAWKASKQLCSKRLIPFLPTLVAALERHEHLHLSEEDRSLLLRVSATTADRLLRPHRKSAPRGLSTTQAGPLLKQQIPIRTFHRWDEKEPGFLEGDLVAHCGAHTEGSYLYTLTLTDIATGWTECLPILYKSPEAVLAAFQQARVLFPFPILGLDVDSGGEFINKALVHYCETEQITFTRGREGFKEDQCFVEQKNGAIVRKVVGHARLVGEQAYRQLCELYRAVRLYVNCFQPSMKLVAKDEEGGKVRRVYDPARTPLQRLLRSEILPPASQQYLNEVAQALDPLRLLDQLESLQQALWRGAESASQLTHDDPVPSLLCFCVQGCLEGSFVPEEEIPMPVPRWQKQQGEVQRGTEVLDWPRTSKDPFEGKWDLILSLVLAHPEWSGSDLFEEMQRLFPGCYRPSQQGTLQNGLRKIRARLLSRMQEPWPQEVIQRQVPIPVVAEPDHHVQEADGHVHAVALSSVPSPSPALQEQVQGAASVVWQQSSTEEAIRSAAVSAFPAARPSSEQPNIEPGQEVPSLDVAGPQIGAQGSLLAPYPVMTIEEAIQSYLQEQRANGRSHKTLEWHQTALGWLEQYLGDERQLSQVCQITESEVRGWFAFLRTTPSTVETGRSVGTIVTYARSARAFCHWLVRKGYLAQMPFAKGTMPRAGKKDMGLIAPDEFERLQLACRPAGGHGMAIERAAARNRALLWVLLDTGMRISELCGLRLSDVDREQRALRVQRTGGKERWLKLSANGWYQLLSYLEQHRPPMTLAEEGQVEEAHLFLSEWYQPLTTNGITLVFARLRKRAGISEKRVSPQVLRDTFAVRYLQEGGEPEALCEMLGLTGVAAVKRYQRRSEQWGEEEEPRELAEEQLFRQTSGSQKDRHRRGSSSESAMQRRTRRGMGSAHSSLGKKPVTAAEDDL